MNDAWSYRDGELHNGPMPLAELQRLIREGQISPNCVVSSPATNGQWMPAAQALASYVPAQAADGGLRYIIPTSSTSGLSLVAGYLGIFSIVIWPLGLFGILLGVLALRDLKKDPGKLGYGRAWTGIVGGVVATLLLLFVFTRR